MNEYTIAMYLAAAVMLVGCQARYTKKSRTGIVDGQLGPCPSSPNCVCSYDDPADKQHYIEPLTYEGTREEAQQKMIAVLNSMKRCKVKEETSDYIWAVFGTKIGIFWDDVEIHFPENEKVIHLRSASRVGHSDFGANRRRAKAIRELYNH